MVNFCRRERRRRRGGWWLNVDKRRFFPPRTTINNTRAPNIGKNRTNTSRLPNARRVRAAKTISHWRAAAIISGPARHSTDPHVRPRRGSWGGRLKGRGDLLFIARLPCSNPSPFRGSVRQNDDRIVFASRNKIEISKLSRTRHAYRT